MKSPAVVALLLAPAVAFGQAIVEYGLGVGRAGVSGAGVSRSTKSIGKALEKSGQQMNRANNRKPQTQSQTQTQAKAAPERPTPTTAEPPAAKTAAIDPTAIQVGMTREELFERFGKPSTRLTQQQGADLIEKCWYKVAGSEPVTVLLKNGRVSSVVS